MTDPIRYYEIQLVAVFDGNDIKIGHRNEIESGPALHAIREGWWAEVTIPYHAPDGNLYGLVVTIANKPADEPALAETMVLKEMAASLWREYQDYAQFIDTVDPADLDFKAAGEAVASDPAPQLPDEAEAIAMMTRAFKEPTDVIIQANSFDLFQLIGLIQFATRGLPAGHRLHSFARQIGDQIAEAVILATGADELRGYIEMGWNPAFDVVQQNDGGQTEAP